MVMLKLMEFKYWLMPHTCGLIRPSPGIKSLPTCCGYCQSIQVAHFINIQKSTPFWDIWFAGSSNKYSQGFGQPCLWIQKRCCNSKQVFLFSVRRMFQADGCVGGRWSAQWSIALKWRSYWTYLCRNSTKS